MGKGLSLQTLNFTCPGCEHSHKVVFKKPALLTPVTCSHECSGCKARFTLQMSKPPGHVSRDARATYMKVIHLTPSGKFVALMRNKEKKKQAAKSPVVDAGAPEYQAALKPKGVLSKLKGFFSGAGG